MRTPPENTPTAESTKEPGSQLCLSQCLYPLQIIRSKKPLDGLKSAPEEVDLDRRFFVALDEHSEANDTMTIGRIGDGAVEGKEGKVQYFSVKANEAAMYLNSIMSNSFDESLQSYQGERRRNGEADLSRGKPYNGPGFEGVRECH